MNKNKKKNVIGRRKVGNRGVGEREREREREREEAKVSQKLSHLFQRAQIKMLSAKRRPPQHTATCPA